jgi:lipopolysaccharide export system protein LptA
MARTSTMGIGLARNAVIAAAVALTCYDGYVSIVKFGSLDPFRGMERDQNALGPSTGVRLANVDMRVYRDGKLTTTAHLDKVDVSKDRETFDLFGLKSGLYRGKADDIRFSADQGNFNAGNQRLSMFGKVRATSRNFDVVTGSANFDRNTEVMQVPIRMTGKLYGGLFMATAMTYNIRTGEASTGPLEWQGKPPAKDAEGVGQEVTPRTWTIHGKHWRQQKGGLQFFENADATDGEVLIKAPLVQRDPKTDVITATGRVTYYSGKSDLIADQVVVYRKEKRAVFTGDVVMLVKPKKDQDQPPKVEPIPDVKPDVPEVKVSDKPITVTEADKKKDDELRSGKSWKDYPLNIKAQSIVYWYGKGSRHAIITGEPVANQDFSDGRWRKGWAHDAYYDGEQDTLQLNSRVDNKDARLKNSIGDVWRGSMIKMSTKDDQDEEDSDVNGSDIDAIYVERSGEDERGPKKTPSGTATGTAPSNPGAAPTPGSTPGTPPAQPGTTPTTPPATKPGGGGGT